MVRGARGVSGVLARVTRWRVLCGALVAVALHAPALRAQPDAERRLPFDWRVRAVDGREIPMARFRGRPIVLNLWATWCTPCVAELGSIERLQDSLRAQGRDDIVFLLVSLETRRSVQRFQDRRPIGLPLFVELDPMPAVLGIRAVPTTWLIDRDGRIAATHRGARVWDAPDAIALVQRALPQ
jgi:thiol-disulfide isomerase/thioredoxin